MTRILLIIAGVVAVMLGYSSMYTVHQTKQALLVYFGEPRDVITEAGLHFKIPWYQVRYIEKRILALDAPAEEVIASDQKRLVVDTFARFRIIDVLKYYQAVGNEAVARNRLGTIINSNTRSVLGGETFSTLLSGERAALMREIRDEVNIEAQALGLEIVDVRIKRADLPQANSDAIYRRMQTEREREAKEFRAQGAEFGMRIRSRADRERTVLLAEAEKNADITRGEGDADAVRIFAAAFGTDVDFFQFYRSMQAYQKALGSDDTTLVLSPDSDFFKFFGNIDGK